MIEAELVSANSEALSFVCDREAATIDPLVKGQQFIAFAGACDGIANSDKSRSIARSIDRFAAFFGVKDLCLALQHACESIDADIDVESSAAGFDDSASLFDARA